MNDTIKEEFLSAEDLDLKALTEEELIACWNAWLQAAQATNHIDKDRYSHSAFGDEVLFPDRYPPR